MLLHGRTLVWPTIAAVIQYFSIYCNTAALGGMLAGGAQAGVRDCGTLLPRLRCGRHGCTDLAVRASRAMVRGVHATVTTDILCDV